MPPKPVEAVQIMTKAPTGTVEFRDDVDLIEQVPRSLYSRLFSLEPDDGAASLKYHPFLPCLEKTDRRYLIRFVTVFTLHDEGGNKRFLVDYISTIIIM